MSVIHKMLVVIYSSESSGLYYKHMVIVYDNSSIVSKWSSKLTDNARIVIYNRNMFVIQATGAGNWASRNMAALIGSHRVEPLRGILAWGWRLKVEY